MGSKIIASGRCKSTHPVENFEFRSSTFFDDAGQELHGNAKIIEKLAAITGIQSRHYAHPQAVASNLAAEAAQAALSEAGLQVEQLDYIIVAHNYGDIPYGSSQSDMVPSLAARVKHQLGSKSSHGIAYDMIFGCAGWVEALIQADAFIRAGLAKRCMVIGAETLSRVVDKHDRDSMIFADGAGAVILSASEQSAGFLASHTATFSDIELDYIYFGTSNADRDNTRKRFIKMNGRKIYEFALNEVPTAMKVCLDKAGIPIEKLGAIFMHQANEKMNMAILERFYKLYDLPVPEGIMPMNVSEYGNSSVATVPTLFDLVRRGELENAQLQAGQFILFAAVGAGMNISAVAYQYA